MYNVRVLRKAVVMLFCFLLLTACGTNKDLNKHTTQDQLASPKGWTQNPDSDFDYSYNSEYQGVELRYIGTSPKVFYPTEFNNDPVVAIGHPENPEVVKEVYIPEGIIAIGYKAFGECVNLENITIPETVEIVESSAFEGCDSLESIYIPDSIEILGNDVFRKCVRLESVRLPDSLTSISDSAFSGCDSLTYIELPSSLKTIGESAFRSCNLESINLPAGLESIGKESFVGNPLTSLTLPSSLKHIGIMAFHGCERLKDINLEDPNAVIDIGAIAFRDTYWANKHPDGFIGLGGSIVEYKGEITSPTLVIPDGIKSIPSDFIFYPVERRYKITEVILPDGIEHIGSEAFSGFDELILVNFPASLVSIDDRAFEDCLSLDGDTTAKIQQYNPDAISYTSGYQRTK